MKQTISRRGAYGLSAILLSVLVLLAVCALCVGAAVLTDRSGAKLDLTASAAFTVSDTIRESFRLIKTPVRITVLYGETAFPAAGVYFAQTDTVLRAAAAENDAITLRYIDPLADPTVKAQYPALTLAQGNLVFENMETGRAEELPLESLFVISNGNILASKAEGMIASKLLSITTADLVTAVFTSGHGEQEAGEFGNLLSLNNFTVSTRATLTESYADADLLILLAPTADFTEQEISALGSFLTNDGQYGKTILYFAALSQPALPELEGFLAGYGIEPARESVYESDGDNTFGADNRFIICRYLNAELASAAVLSGLPVSVPYARPVNKLFDHAGEITVTPLLGYYDTAFSLPIDTDGLNSDDARIGNLYAALLSCQAAKANGEDLRSYLAVFGSAHAADDALLQYQSLGNAEYLIGLATDLSGSEISIETTQKSLTGEYLSFTARQASRLGWLFAAVLPLLVLTAGGYVYAKRRNL